VFASGVAEEADDNVAVEAVAGLDVGGSVWIAEGVVKVGVAVGAGAQATPVNKIGRQARNKT